MDIWSAIDNHNIKRLEEILTKDASIVNTGLSTRSLFRRTEQDKPIHLATRKGFTTVVQRLLHYGADVNTPNHEGKTALHIAADCDFVDLVALFLEKEANVDATNFNGSTALHLAAIRGYLEILAMLLEHEANPNLIDSKSKSPLYYAAKRASIPCVKSLLEHGADARESSVPLINFLHKAIVHGDTYTLSLLLANNANINSQDESGATALHHAVSAKKVMCVKMLMEKGADAKIKDSNSNSALSLAIALGSREIIHYFANANGSTTICEEVTENAKKIDIIVIKKQKEISKIGETSQKNEEELQSLQRELVNLNEMKGVLQQELDQSNELIAREEERIAIHRGLFEGLERDERNLSTRISKENNNIEKHNSQKQNLKDEIAELQKLKRTLAATGTSNNNTNGASPAESNPIPEEYLECPICCTIPKPPVHVYQCHEGHVYCGECKGKPNMHRCPVCKTDISNSSIRNRYMEARIEELITSA